MAQGGVVGIPAQRQRGALDVAAPAIQSAAVISEAGSRQQAGAKGRRIAGSPGEQLGGPVARQDPIRIQIVQGRNHLAQARVAPIGVGAQPPWTAGLAQGLP